MSDTDQRRGLGLDVDFPAWFETAEIPPEATGVLVIDLKSLKANYKTLAALAAPAEAAAVVKADAYGTGVASAVAALLEEGCRTFFVATLGEARAVRQAAPDAVVYVLNGLFPGTAPLFQACGARPILGSLAEIEEWASFCHANGVRLPAAIHIDTGINRLGLDVGAVETLAAEPGPLAAFDVALIMSHFACADDPAHPKNAGQRALFNSLSEKLPGVPRSLANSAGIFLGADYHYDLVRPGIALYGGRARNEEPYPMESVVWLYGRIAQVRWVEKGETAGYGAAHTLKRRTKVVTVSAGYADGYMRALSASDEREGAFAVVDGYRLPMLGRVSMDLALFDATDLPDDAVKRGGFVELIGQAMTVDDIAALANTIGYEVLTSLGGRYHRLYMNG